MKKNRLFTMLSAMGVLAFCFGMADLNAQSNQRGNGWSDTGSPLLLNMNFQDFEHLHSRTHENEGNSRNAINPELEPDDPNYITFYHRNQNVNRTYIGSTLSANIDFMQCAFAPTWMTAYAKKDLDQLGAGNNTPGVTNGFAEISRNRPQDYTIAGHLIVDLSNLEYIESIQYSHSSSGGLRRGLIVEYSIDNGANWDTLRFQPGDNMWAQSFTRDIWTGEDTPNTYRCDDSAYGMLWEDAIFYAPDEGGFKMRIRVFETPYNQVVRIHDLKVYGTLATSVRNVNASDLDITSTNFAVSVSEPATISLYSITGALIKTVSDARSISITDMPAGLYIVKAEAGSRGAVTKILKK